MRIESGDGYYVKAAILTCATIKKTPGADIGNGISMDQVAAQRITSDSAAVPGTRYLASSDRRGRRSRIHTRLRIAHRMEGNR